MEMLGDTPPSGSKLYRGKPFVFDIVIIVFTESTQNSNQGWAAHT